MVADLTKGRPSQKSTDNHLSVRDQSVHELFEAQAARTPQAVALVFEGRRLTYRQLSRHSDRFALRLQSLGVRSGTFVALYIPRCLENILCLLGILKAGAAYVTLDMESPADRLELMLSDVQPTVIITLHPLAEDLPSNSAKLIFLNEEFDLRDPGADRLDPDFQPPPVSTTDLAYVAFTSGSSGAPKGVCITHRAVVGLAKSDDFISVRR